MNTAAKTERALQILSSSAPYEGECSDDDDAWVTRSSTARAVVMKSTESAFAGDEGDEDRQSRSISEKGAVRYTN